ncbi:MAG: mycofactocin system FadH/OYE family oxidoreductase 2 [Oscillochloridaceae bacterium]|nr:mycofactocin system FadH/OYE family oxidoreductase 2 [Chloroflexaceae bacterium]MDW8392010.1 mycofactocin system FadH/OYE family oxidoreductase 2 [Oscillochloridaceae bacterium]
MNQGARLLFTPIKVGSLTLNNRIVFSAHLTNYAEGYMPSERHVYYYRERARGGAGLIITEEHSTHPTDHPYEKLIHAFNPAVIPGYRQITAAVHAEGTPILAQINHNGGQSSGMFTRLPVWAPSSVADPMFREVPKAVELEDIQEIIAGYAQVAYHTRLGGFDGVELQCSHSSIVRQFLSRHNNLRTDGYGGGLEQRMRLLREIIAAIRARVGRDYVLGVRLCGDELIRDGIVLDEAVAAARILEADGLIDYINTSIGTATHTLYMIEASMHIPPGYALFISSAIRKAVRLPVIGVGRIKDPIQAERVLQEGHADLVGIVRAQIADPEFARKSRENRVEDIRLCLSCNQECVGRMGLNRWMGCIETPATGREKELGIGTLKPAPRPKRVTVVGGGPAGLKAAVIAARRGHRVTLYERQPELGGQVNLAVKVTNRAEFGDLVRNLLHELHQLDVSVHTGVTADAEMVLAGQPDAVVIATGSTPDRNAFPGADGPEVADVTDILAGRVRAGRRVMIIDRLGFHEATSVAEYLAEQGCQVEIVTPTLYVGQDLGITLDLENWYRRARRLNIVCTPNVSVLNAANGVVTAVHNYSGQLITFAPVDTIVLAVQRRADAGLYFALKGRVPELHRIGDALAPRRAHAAIIEGERVGRAL